jgi:hypothetical protein
MSNKTTDTPRTDEQIWTAFHHHEMCDVVDKDFARQLERELNELWSRFDKQMEAEAEVERLKRPYGCKCQTLRERALGDGCDECNKALVIEMLTDERDELEAEVERLKAVLQKLPDAISHGLSDDFRPEAARQLWASYIQATKALNKE